MQLKLPLFEFQNEGVKSLASNPYFILADEMGTGKSVQALAAAEKLSEEKGYSKCLIVVPNSLKFSWENEINKFSNSSYKIIDGSAKKRELLWETDTFFTVINYELLLTTDFEKHIAPIKWDIVILDEATFIKNRSAQRSKKAYMIPRKVRWALSGTPVELSPLDLWGIMFFLNPLELGNYYAFKNTYCVHSNIYIKRFGQLKSIRTVTGFRNLESLHRRIQHVYLRRTKAEVAKDLPEKITSLIHVNLTDEQKYIYDTLKNQIKELNKKSESILGLITKMRLLCNDAKCYDVSFESKSEKMNLLEDMINDGLSNCVIFTSWVKSLDIICDKLKHLKKTFGVIQGATPTKERQQLVDDFALGKYEFLVCTGAAEFGFNMQSSNNMILFDSPWNWAKLQQRIDRIHRIGSKNTVNIYVFSTKNTIEERVIDAIMKKKDMFDTLFAQNKEQFLFDNLFEKQGELNG